MNVLLSSCTHWWNAEAAYAAVRAELLRQAGHRVHVLAPAGTRNHQHLQQRGLPVVTDLLPAPGNPLRWPGVVARLAAFQRQREIDVVDVFRSAELPFHVLAARRTPGTAVVRTRGSARPLQAHALNRWLYARGAHGVIASCDVLRRELVGRLGVPEARVHTIHYPAPEVDAPDAPTRRAWRQALAAELALPPEVPWLAIVGRVKPEKGHERLLRALAALHEEAGAAAPALLIADKRYPGETAERERLQALARELGLAERVRWLGFRDDVGRVMAAADAGVIPSLRSEMNCRVAVEFFAHGTPVVAFPTGALPEVVQDGVSGLVCAGHGPADLATALGRLAAEPALRDRLARGALKAVRERFSPQGFLERTEAAYAAALDRARMTGGEGLPGGAAPARME